MTETPEPKIEFNELGFVIGYYCPSCGGQLKESHVDDVGTRFFQCQKCGQKTAKPKSEERRKLEGALQERGESAPVVAAVAIDENRRQSQADKLVILCLAQEPELFHDQTKTPYARIRQEGALVTLPIRGKAFRTWLANLLWQEEGKVPSTEGVYGALRVLEGIALFHGREYHLHNRVAPAEDGVWIDMCDEGWRAIKVTAEGWHIVENPPILFRRYSHQKPLVEPKPNGNPSLFLDFINIPKEDKTDGLVVLVAAISYLIPTIPHVILVLYGIQGSGKTLFFKLIRSLVDPSAVEVLTLPRDERERVQQLDHHWCAFYDNVTMLPTWMSDTLCRAATGGGFTKRELYTDDDDMIYSFRRCVGLNGINIAAHRGDLLDRSLLVGLHDIPKDRRRTEERLIAEFEKYKAEILGGFLDTLVKALQLLPSVNPPQLFRMADFTRWGCAIAMALGYKEEEFIEAYGEKVNAQIEEAAHASPVATVLLDYVESVKEWEGTPSQLFTILLGHAKLLGMSTHQKGWPKAPHILVRQLNELAPSLKALGWEVTTGIKSGSTRRIVITSAPSVPSAPSPSGQGKKEDGRDAISPISSSRLSLDDLVSVYWADSFFGEHECGVCGYKRMTPWKGKTNKGLEIPVCEDCQREYEKKRSGEIT